MNRNEGLRTEVRLDKWLWAARFFKTRTLAAEAAGGGKVEINGERAKPSRIVRAADTVENTATVQGPEPEMPDQHDDDRSGRDWRLSRERVDPADIELLPCQ